MRRASSCIATSLKASVGPWNSSRIHRLRSDLNERRDGRVAETRIGIAGERNELAARHCASRERLQNRCRNLGEGLAGKGRDGVRLQSRPGLRHVKAAVARETRKQRVLEA